MTAVRYPKSSAALVDALACGTCAPCSLAARNGAGFVHCPAHDDRTPSLSISDGGRRILFHCWAGCDQQDVLAALRERGLWRSRR